MTRHTCRRTSNAVTVNVIPCIVCRISNNKLIGARPRPPQTFCARDVHPVRATWRRGSLHTRSATWTSYWYKSLTSSDPSDTEINLKNGLFLRFYIFLIDSSSIKGNFCARLLPYQSTSKNGFLVHSYQPTDVYNRQRLPEKIYDVALESMGFSRLLT